jgi:hypothetical protein
VGGTLDFEELTRSFQVDFGRKAGAEAAANGDTQVLTPSTGKVRNKKIQDQI